MSENAIARLERWMLTREWGISLAYDDGAWTVAFTRPDRMIAVGERFPSLGKAVAWVCRVEAVVPVLRVAP